MRNTIAEAADLAERSAGMSFLVCDPANEALLWATPDACASAEAGAAALDCQPVLRPAALPFPSGFVLLALSQPLDRFSASPTVLPRGHSAQMFHLFAFRWEAFDRAVLLECCLAARTANVLDGLGRTAEEPDRRAGHLPVWGESDGTGLSAGDTARRMYRLRRSSAEWLMSDASLMRLVWPFRTRWAVGEAPNVPRHALRLSRGTLNGDDWAQLRDAYTRPDGLWGFHPGAAEMIALIFTFWQFASAPHGESRSVRRRLERAASGPASARLPMLKVLDLPPPRPAPSAVSEETGPPTRRHWVRAHWRRQWYPSRQEHDLIWIPEHARGDAALGWVPRRPTVYRLNRPEEQPNKEETAGAAAEVGIR